MLNVILIYIQGISFLSISIYCLILIGKRSVFSSLVSFRLLTISSGVLGLSTLTFVVLENSTAFLVFSYAILQALSSLLMSISVISLLAHNAKKAT
jgi:hypothetical protein